MEANNTLEVLGSCLDVAGAGTANGTRSTTTPATAPARRSGCTESNGELVNTNSGKCLDDTGYGGSGTQVQIWACADSSNQQWNIP